MKSLLSQLAFCERSLYSENSLCIRSESDYFSRRKISSKLKDQSGFCSVKNHDAQLWLSPLDPISVLPFDLGNVSFADEVRRHGRGLQHSRGTTRWPRPTPQRQLLHQREKHPWRERAGPNSLHGDVVENVLERPKVNQTVNFIDPKRMILFRILPLNTE